VNRPNLDFRGYTGTVISGEISVGDKIKVLPSNKISVVKEIVLFKDKLQTATESSSVTLTLEDEIDISRGDLIIKDDKKIVIKTSLGLLKI